MKKALEIVPVEHLDQVLANALALDSLKELYTKDPKKDLLDIYDTGDDSELPEAPAHDATTQPAAH